MESFLNEEKEKYFLKLTQEVANLPHHFNVKTIFAQEEETKKDKPIKMYTLDTLCPFPFDNILDMPPFPKGFGFPKYDKYFGNSDPQDHLREFDTFSMEFMHN